MSGFKGIINGLPFTATPVKPYGPNKLYRYNGKFGAAAIAAHGSVNALARKGTKFQIKRGLRKIFPDIQKALTGQGNNVAIVVAQFMRHKNQDPSFKTQKLFSIKCVGSGIDVPTAWMNLRSTRVKHMLTALLPGGYFEGRRYIITLPKILLSHEQADVRAAQKNQRQKWESAK